jgi:hypothetical protein
LGQVFLGGAELWRGDARVVASAVEALRPHLPEIWFAIESLTPALRGTTQGKYTYTANPITTDLSVVDIDRIVRTALEILPSFVLIPRWRAS